MISFLLPLKTPFPISIVALNRYHMFIISFFDITTHIANSLIKIFTQLSSAYLEKSTSKNTDLTMMSKNFELFRTKFNLIKTYPSISIHGMLLYMALMSNQH